MKKLITMSLLSATLTLAPARGEAVAFIFAGITEGFHPFGDGDPGSVIACLVLLPFCLLDEETPSRRGAIARSELAKQGYSTVEIMEIERDQKILEKKLRSLKLKLTIQKSETPESLVSGLRSMHPGISNTYLRFFRNEAGI